MRKPIALAILMLTGLLMAEPSVASLIKSFPDASAESKTAILRFLIQNKNQEALPVYMEYLGYGLNKVFVIPETKDFAPEIRELSAKGMASLKDPKTLQFLVFMKNQEPLMRVQREIIFAVGELGDITALPWLTRWLMETTDQAIVYECVAAIAKYKDDRAIPALLDCMRGSVSYKTRYVAENALRNLGWPDKIGY